MKKQFSFLIVLFISLAFSGCKTANPSIYTTQSLATSTLEMPDQPDLAIEKESITATVGKIIPTFTPTSVNASEPIETIEPAIAMKTVQPLLKQPFNCGPIPCFWGIIPGKTTLTEVREYFGSLGFNSLEGVDPSTRKIFYSITYDTSKGKTSGLEVNFDTSNLVEYMKITPDIPTPNNGEPPELGGYSPEILIKMYGSPSKVNFAMALGQMSNILVDMTMYFEGADIIVNYHGYHMKPDNFCPLSAPFDFVRLWIGKNPENTPSYETLPLEKVSTLNTEEFSRLILGDPQKACFSLNVDMFK